jgi:cysteine desulfurase family protein
LAGNVATSRIYLDNAATSWPKPESVYEAVDSYQRRLGAPAGRSAYREAAEVERMIRDARSRTARLLGAQQPQQVVFTNNGTDSLNLALHGILRPGDHVVTTTAEHNSTIRPLRYLAAHRDVRLECVPVDSSGIVDPDDVRRAIRPETRLVALIHASNVTGAIQPIDAVAQLVSETETLLLVDAAQSLGQIPLHVQDQGIHLLAAPGHKGLLGPLGTGILYVHPKAAEILIPMRQGGTGTRSESDQQPASLPDGFESGNHNVPGIVGLRAGVEYVQQQGVEQIRQHELQLAERLADGLRSISTVTVYGPAKSNQRVGVISFTVNDLDPQDIASMLDSAHAIQVRSGLHCAPSMHAAMGTLSGGGTVRFSLGPFNTIDHIDKAIQAVDEIASSTQF